VEERPRSVRERLPLRLGLVRLRRERKREPERSPPELSAPRALLRPRARVDRDAQALARIALASEVAHQHGALAELLERGEHEASVAAADPARMLKRTPSAKRSRAPKASPPPPPPPRKPHTTDNDMRTVAIAVGSVLTLVTLATVVDSATAVGFVSSEAVLDAAPAALAVPAVATATVAAAKSFSTAWRSRARDYDDER